MKLCYIVYREDNVMVFYSQVLEYLQRLKDRSDLNEVRLILFRHQKNLRKKEEIELKIKKYIDNFKTFSSLAPPLSMLQLNIDAKRLKNYVNNLYSDKEEVAVICRGDFATYIASKAFRNIENSRILYDNRGLAVEESLMSHSKSFLHIINRKVKLKAINYAKDHCDMYNFVTNVMRKYFIEKYNYSEKLLYTIIPTLFKVDKLDFSRLEEIKKKENYLSNQYIVTYIGSAAIWQSTEKLLKVIQKINEKYQEVRYFILTNQTISGIEKISENLKEKIIVKQVPHSDIKYYLYLSNLGIVIRDNSIVNKVAAPTKIAEYLINGIHILYDGEIGILSDLKDVISKENLIRIDKNECWINEIGKDIENKNKLVDNYISKYFDMKYRQEETIQMIKKSFNNIKVR